MTFLQQWLEESSGKIHLVVDKSEHAQGGKGAAIPGQ